MTRTTMCAAFAAFLAVSPMALAAETPAAAAPATEAASPAAGGSAMQGRIDPSEVLAGKLKGAAVYDSANKKVGTIKDIIIGHTGRVAGVVLNSGNRNVAVRMSELKIVKEANSNDIDKVMLNTSEAQLKTAPAIDLGNGNAETGAGSGSTTAPAEHAK